MGVETIIIYRFEQNKFFYDRNLLAKFQFQDIRQFIM